MHKKFFTLICSTLFLFLSLAISQAKTFLPIDKNAEIQSIDIQDKSAIIHMNDYDVTVPLEIMDGKSFKRAHGITPKGMTIGLKYNDTLLRLIAIDKVQKNYMSVDLLAKGAKKMDLPEDYKTPIASKELYLSAIQFIQSYPLWPANSVSRGFDLMTNKEKGIINLFPAITLELADKLCRSDHITSGIFELLSDQNGMTCDNLSSLNEPQKLQELQTAANQERDLLIDVLECTQGRKQPKLCQEINKKLADKIVKSSSFRL